ncbi:hypothetical protein [Rhodovulum sulfidophilum]|uniref:hypothetical protein n=1 Tax=Rhodovulum sulfidophilum TaxID=35806 RepID=UPI000952E171|nr:hypothetical protein [Rhodovulum sulfidophilum]OLS42569.1 hypothetical protein BV392_20380 [Rhodovulum sulfidophilum]
MTPPIFLLFAIANCAWLFFPLSGQAGTAQALSLSFNAYVASPAVLTHFSIEQPLAPVPAQIVSGSADIVFPRLTGAAVLSTPKDVNRDGKWRISAQWVDLISEKAWRASVDVPVKALDQSYSLYTLLVIFGPNGELLVGSDKISRDPSDRVDVVRTCGIRVPEADRDWKSRTGYFPELPRVMAYRQENLGRASVTTACPPPGDH